MRLHSIARSSVSPQQALADLSRADLADALFTSTLQQHDHPSADQVREAVAAALACFNGDCRGCAACVAQEAGDHPEAYEERMRWALATVDAVYGPVPPVPPAPSVAQVA